MIIEIPEPTAGEIRTACKSREYNNLNLTKEVNQNGF